MNNLLMHFEKIYMFGECTLFSPKEGAEILTLTFKNDTYFYFYVCVCTCLSV